MNAMFFHIPSLSMYRWLEPILLELRARHCRVTHYNENRFGRYIDNASIRFVPYDHYDGYFPEKCDSSMGISDLGILLLETAEHTVDCVEREVLRETPDVIIHSKFAVAAKVVAAKHGIPAVCLTTGFVFHPKVIARQIRESGRPVDVASISALLQFRAKAKDFYRMRLRRDLDANDVFVNDERLNLIIGLKAFQPDGSALPSRPTLVGPTMQVGEYSKSYDLIYVSLGGVFVNNRRFFEICIEALSGLRRQVIISLGDRLAPRDFGGLPENVQVHRFVNQKDILQKAAVFVTQGGDRSVAEGIYYDTPMLVVPQIPEQHHYARQIQNLGIGKYVIPEDLSPEILQTSVLELLENPMYRFNVQHLHQGLPQGSAATLACDYIEQLAGLSMRKVTVQASNTR